MSMAKNKDLTNKLRNEHYSGLSINLDTSIKNFVEIIRKDKLIVKRKYLTLGFYNSLEEISRYMETIGDLKKNGRKCRWFFEIEKWGYL